MYFNKISVLNSRENIDSGAQVQLSASLNISKQFYFLDFIKHIKPTIHTTTDKQIKMESTLNSYQYVPILI